MPKPYIRALTTTLDYHCSAYRALIKLACLQAILVLTLLAWICYGILVPNEDSYYATTVRGETIAITPQLFPQRS